MKENSVWNLLNELSQKRGITEILINNSQSVFVERSGQLIQLNTQLKPEDIDSFALEVANFNNRKFDNENPILDGNLPDGSRINIISPPFVKGSKAISIRKYLPHIKSFSSGPSVFGLDVNWVKFFKSVVRSRSNVVISGGTGVGKTTFLNLLLQEIDIADRVITIEDTIELSLNTPNVLRLEVYNNFNGSTGPSVQDLVKNTLRMRPDRIILGEVRSGEAFDLLQAMNTGHEGSMTSVHANNTGECLVRLENLAMMSGHDFPVTSIRKQLSQSVDFIIQLNRTRDGKRIVSSIQEITGLEGTTILSQQLAIYEDGELKKTGITPRSIEKLVNLGEIKKDFFS